LLQNSNIRVSRYPFSLALAKQLETVNEVLPLAKSGAQLYGEQGLIF
jgi:hypothetical protein